MLCLHVPNINQTGAITLSHINYRSADQVSHLFLTYSRYRGPTTTRLAIRKRGVRLMILYCILAHICFLHWPMSVSLVYTESGPLLGRLSRASYPFLITVHPIINDIPPLQRSPPGASKRSPLVGKNIPNWDATVSPPCAVAENVIMFTSWCNQLRLAELGLALRFHSL